MECGGRPTALARMQYVVRGVPIDIKITKNAWYVDVVPHYPSVSSSTIFENQGADPEFDQWRAEEDNDRTNDITKKHFNSEM